MIPSIFPSDATYFNTNGMGLLNRAVSCTVKQELGSTGVYELNMGILSDDPNFDMIQVGNIIGVRPNLTDEPQGFVIEQISKPINNLVTVYAVHIAQHRAKLIPVSPVNATDLQDALTQIAANSLETNPFTISSPRTTATAYVTDTPRSLREIMGGAEGSLLDVYGGEYIFDNFNIELVTKRGKDSGLNVLYGHSMSDFNMDEEFSFSKTITGIVPYWYSENDGLVQGSAQYSDYVDYYKYHKTIVKDYSEEFENKPTIAQLESQALSDVQYLGDPAVNIKVAFNHFDEYIQGNIETMQLGDTVRIINPNYDFSSSSRIVSMTFNVLSEQYDEIEVGDLQQNINEAISDIGNNPNDSNQLGGNNIESVWTNSSPNSSMGATSWILNCTKQPRFLIVKVVQYVSATYKYYETFLMDASITGQQTHITSRYDTANNYDIGRAFTYNVSTDTFALQIAYYKTSFSSFGSTNSAFLVPIQIWAVYQ